MTKRAAQISYTVAQHAAHHRSHWAERPHEQERFPGGGARGGGQAQVRPLSPCALGLSNWHVQFLDCNVPRNQNWSLRVGVKDLHNK